jgi:hypothetical protein
MNYRGIIAILTLLWAVAGAESRTLLHCLGNEELTIHKAKREGPVYQLNQLFINELSSFDDITLKGEYIEQVCAPGYFAPSVNLLKLLLLNGKNAFSLRNSGNDGLAVYKHSLINDFLDRVPHIFFQYLANLQSLAATPKCLQQKIPEVAYFLERYRYLETDFPMERLMADKAKIERVFDRLLKLDEVLKECREDKEKSRKKQKTNTSPKNPAN